MATVLPTYDWSRVSKANKTPRSRFYPWDDWLDGRIWLLAGEGADFDGTAKSMEGVIRATAYQKGVKVRVRTTEDGKVVLQRHDAGGRESGKTRSPSRAAIEAAALTSPDFNVNAGKPRKRIVRG